MICARNMLKERKYDLVTKQPTGCTCPLNPAGYTSSFSNCTLPPQAVPIPHDITLSSTTLSQASHHLTDPYHPMSSQKCPFVESKYRRHGQEGSGDSQEELLADATQGQL
jgi:hypothetical protein